MLTNEGTSLFGRLTAGRTGSEVMLRKANGDAWRTSHQLRPIAQACQRAKINPPVSFHALRHTFGTRMAAVGVPMRTLQEWMGHRDIETTQRYADYSPSAHESAFVEAAFGSGGAVRPISGRAA